MDARIVSSPASFSRRAVVALGIVAAIAAPGAAQAADALVAANNLTPEIAFKAARTALEYCRGKGFQVGVAVVDRMGVTQVFLRDRFGGAHTVDMAANKAWTAASFRIATAALALETQQGRPMSGIRALPRVLAAGGGVPIEAAGAVVGAIGVSGAPGGDADEDCAKAGVKAIQADIEL